MGGRSQLMNYETGESFVPGSWFLVLSSLFLVPCFWFLQGGGECFQGGSLDGGFVQAAQAGGVMDTHDELTQTFWDLAKTYLQCLQNTLLKTLLKALLEALLLAFFTKLIGKCHGGGLNCLRQSGKRRAGSGKRFVLGYWFLVPCSWFLVPGSWFFVLGSLFFARGLVRSFGPEEIGDEGTDFGVGLVSEIVESLELVGIDVFLVQCDIEFALDLGTGTLRIPEEFDEFLVASAIKTLGDVVHDGAGGPLDLIFESEVPDELSLIGDAVN